MPPQLQPNDVRSRDKPDAKIVLRISRRSCLALSYAAGINPPL
jgi:hypothetical protein